MMLYRNRLSPGPCGSLARISGGDHDLERTGAVVTVAGETEARGSDRSVIVESAMNMPAVPRAATADHLTVALERAGVLGGPGVLSDLGVREAVVESDRTTIVSRIIRLRLIYDGSSSTSHSVILKTGRPDRINPHWNGGKQEVAFYTPDRPQAARGDRAALF